jgi:hypothetical protein
MRRSIVLVLLAALMVFAVVPAASAHVHRFNPVGCLTSDSPNSGAAVGFVKAADAASPMNGPTPIIPENASGELPSGGQGAEHAC